MARPFTLANGLECANYEVIYAADTRFDNLFREIPGKRETVFSLSSEQFLESLAKGQPLYDDATLVRYVEDDLALIDRTKPDIIVGDFRLSLSVSARMSKIPYTTISNVYWSPFARQRYLVPELPLTRLLGVPLAQLMFDLVRPFAFALHATPLNRVRRRFGLASLGTDLRRIYTDADLTLYADVPGMINTEPLPTQHRYIGPILWSPDVPLPDWWDSLGHEVPLVYVTPGSSGDVQRLSILVEAIAELPIKVIVATAGRWTPARELKNVFCADFLPGMAAAHKASLVICNGGSPTTAQALAAGTPIIGVPQNLDQYLNMASIEMAGAGITLRSGSLNRKSLLCAVRMILDDKGYQKHASEMQIRIEALSTSALFKESLAELA